MKLFIKTEIQVNDKDKNRCARSCQHIEKNNGIYQCTLFEQDVDVGDDDEIGYGFARTDACLANAIVTEDLK